MYYLRGTILTLYHNMCIINIISIFYVLHIVVIIDTDNLIHHNIAAISPEGLMLSAICYKDDVMGTVESFLIHIVYRMVTYLCSC